MDDQERTEWTTVMINALAGYHNNVKDIEENVYNKEFRTKGIMYSSPAILMPALLVHTSALVTQSYILLDIANTLTKIAEKSNG